MVRVSQSQTCELARFLHSICFDTFGGRQLVAILSGYTSCFDCSMDAAIEPTANTVVAGYLSSMEEWEHWEFDWKLTLADFDVPYFHMKEFVARRKAFSAPKWKSESYRKQFLSRLIAITNRSMIASFASVISHEQYQLANNFYELDAIANPYALAGRDCAYRVRQFLRSRSDMPLSFVFERGDEGKGMLLELIDASRLPTPSFKRPRPDPDAQRDIDDPPVIQLQACDLIAWEIRRGEKDWQLEKPLRQSLMAIGKPKRREWRRSGYDFFETFLRWQKIPLRDDFKDLSHFDHFGPLKNWMADGV